MKTNKGKGRNSPAPKTKRCSTCKLRQLVKHFDRRTKSSKDGYRGQCKRCMNGGSKGKSNRKRHLRIKFGITVEHYDLLLAKQGGVCGICKGVNASGMRLAVDHDHITKLVRGLLCSKCNRGLGKFEDNIQLLTAAIIYLEESNATKSVG